MFAGFPAGMVEFTVCPGLRQRDLFSEFARLPAADRMDGIGESAMIPEVDQKSPGPQWAAERHCSTVATVGGSVAWVTRWLTTCWL